MSSHTTIDTVMNAGNSRRQKNARNLKRQKIYKAKTGGKEEMRVEAGPDNLKVDGSAKIILRFPSFTESHIVVSRKQWLLEKKGLTLDFEVPLLLREEAADRFLETMICAARIIHLDEGLFYFVEDYDDGPFSPRNELEALSSILSSLAISISQSGSDALKALEKIQQKTTHKILSVENDLYTVMNRISDAAAAANDLLDWAKYEGMETMLNITCFEEAGKGLVASRDIQIEDVVLEIPMSLVITKNLFERDMDLKKLDLEPEDERLLCIMKERHNSQSYFKSYFDSLPAEFKTGLSFGDAALKTLSNTQLYCYIRNQKQDLRDHFDLMINPSLEKHNDLFQPCCGLSQLASSNWDEYMFAVELWNSNRINVIFDEELRTCLVPVTGFFNHSVNCDSGYHIQKWGM